MHMEMKKIKQCPICRFFIDKEDGCASIKCKYCKIKQNYNSV